MPREVVEIPLSRDPRLLYESAAVFLAVLAYPDHEDQRDRFCAAWMREHLKMRAKEDAAFASMQQPIRPGLFLMSDVTVEGEMKEGGKRLSDRERAFINTNQLFHNAEHGRNPAHIEVRALDAFVQNNAEGRATLARLWEDRTWVGDSKSESRNQTTRILKPSRSIIHATNAYWKLICFIKEYLGCSENDAQRHILHNADVFRGMLMLAEFYRTLAPSIPELRVSEDELIEFRVV